MSDSNYDQYFEGSFGKESYRILPSMTSLVKVVDVTIEKGKKHEGLNYVLHLRIEKPIAIHEETENEEQLAQSLIGCRTTSLIEIKFDKNKRVRNPQNGLFWRAVKALTGKAYKEDERLDVRDLKELKCYVKIERKKGAKQHVNSVSQYFHVSEFDGVENA